MRLRFGFTGQVLAGAVLLALLPGQVTAAAPSVSVAPPAARDLDAAVSEPRTDSMYPDVGHREVDALSYDLDLTWNRESRKLIGRATIVFRAAATKPRFALDFGRQLRTTRVTVDGRRVHVDHRGATLAVDHRIVEDERYTLRVEYRGHPKPIIRQTERTDGKRRGWLVDRQGRVATLQEPYGAFTWYPVNDHPSDKAFYSVAVTAPPGWVGVSNGELVGREQVAGRTVTRWRMDQPAASYLVTVAIGDYTETRDTSASGVPITYWTPTGADDVLTKVRETASALDWLEARLGPYPFSTLGVVVVNSQSAMETQSTITLGNRPYPLSKAVIVHELAHQWYGDLVTPTDWSDLWMNEGMAMHLQDVWSAEQDGRAVFAHVGEREFDEWWLREQYGPPARYDPGAFGMSNVYFGAELMWDEVLRRVGWQRYWELVRAWPQTHANGNATYDEIVGWWAQQTGLRRSFFDRWLLGRVAPNRSALVLGGTAEEVRTTRAARRPADRADDPVPFAEVRAALVRVADRLDAYAARHEGRYPDFDEGSSFAARVVEDADYTASAFYVHDEERTSYCLFPVSYDGGELDLVYDSGADSVVDGPWHQLAPDSLCHRLSPVLERTRGLQSRTDDLIWLLSRANDVPQTLAGLLAAQEADSGYLFPPSSVPFEIADYARLAGDHASGFRVCALDGSGGALTFTTEPPLEPPYLHARTFLYEDSCTYAG